jgi:hypothetical protein
MPFLCCYVVAYLVISRHVFGTFIHSSSCVIFLCCMVAYLVILTHKFANVQGSDKAYN